MPATSKAQQRLMGMAYAYKKGELDAKEASQEVKDLADSMTLKQLKKYAATKHEGLPDKVDDNLQPGDVGGMGPIKFPTATENGSGDVPAGQGDAEEEYKKKRRKMKHLKNFESFLNSGSENAVYEKIKLGSYYFNKGQFSEFDLPAKGETVYALITHNTVEVNKQSMYLRSEGDMNIGAGFRPNVLAVAEDEASIKAAYDTQLKVGGTGANLSFSYGTIATKGQNVSYNEIDGHLAKGTIK